MVTSTPGTAVSATLPALVVGRVFCVVSSEVFAIILLIIIASDGDGDGGDGLLCFDRG